MTTTDLRALAFLALTLPCGAFAADGAAGGTATAPAEQAAPQLSEAETRMWMTDQLRAVARPGKLHYEFHKTGSYEAGFSDTVELEVRKLNADGSKDVSLEFFTRERRAPTPPVETVSINPVLRTYMEGDIREMNRLTDPNGTARERWRYFQRRIKFALAESAEVKAVDFEFNGRKWHGHEISFAPYVNDPKRDQFEQFADKRYRVIVSDDLPGYLYRIETEIPAGKDAKEPLIREVLQLTQVQPAS